MLLFATENRGWLSPPGLEFARFLEKQPITDASWDKEEREYDEE